MRLKLRQLAHALAVWRHGNFRRAAAEQNLSQPALSRSIHNLEEALGVPLFDRQAAEVTLTTFGEAFLHRAEAILIEAAELEREMSLMKGLGTGRFSVAIGVYPAAMSGVRALAELLKNHPGLQVRLELRHWRDVERMVRNRQVDIGFGELAHLQEASELHLEPIARHEVVFFCRGGHPLLAKANVSTTDLDAYPFAGPPVPYRLAHLFPKNCNADEKSGDLFPPILVENVDAAAAIVAATDAISAAPPLQIEPLIRSGTLGVLPFRAPWLCADYGFMRLASRSLSPAAEAFVDLVKEIEVDVARRNQALADELFQERRLAS
jgi:DNA-binding transcriptional LysR family regulator